MLMVQYVDDSMLMLCVMFDACLMSWASTRRTVFIFYVREEDFWVGRVSRVTRGHESRSTNQVKERSNPNTIRSPKQE